MKHLFALIVEGQLETYHRWEDIPAVFDHVIAFKPAIPPPPHTPEQHEEIALWPGRLEQLMEVERARSHANR